jgi:uncharacterized repeat protein (TIGR01451 family)
LIDFPQDPGCISNQDNDEFNSIVADLSISKNGPSSVIRGNTVTYTLVGTNAGPNTATNVTFADPIPAGLTFNAAGSSINCIQNGSNILCNNITLTNGQSTTVSVSFNVPSSFTCNGVIQNAAAISTSATDPNPANNQSNVVSTTVTCVQCSDNVDNDGDGAIDFPNDFSCSSATDNDETLPRAQCQDSIDNDGDGFIDFPQDPGCLSNQDNDEFNSIVADLSVTKTGPSTVVRGNTVTYTLTGTNAGPNTATNVTFADAIPSGLTFNAAGSSVSCIQNGANILCNNITLTAGQSATVTIAFNVPSTFTCSGVIQNQASISTSATDPNPANNQSAVVNTTVTCPTPTFALSKTDGKTQTIPGDTLNYVISITNTSVTNATNVSVTDTLPSNVTFVSASGGTIAGNVVTFVIPAINAGQTITRTVSVTVNAGTANGTILTNTASIPSASLNATDTTTVFVAVTNADLSIVKSGVNSIQRGSTLLYTLTATNAGPATATNVNIIDPIPAGLTFNAAQSDVSCIQNGANILCNNLTLTSGQSATRIIAFDVPSTFTCNGTIQNQASVNTSATDPNPANNQSAVVSTTVTCPVATFSIAKTDGKTQTVPGDTLNYVISVTNTSVTNATNVTVTDTVPSNVTFVSASGGTLTGNVVTFVIPTLNAGQTVTRTLSVTVNAGTTNGTVITNTASVNGTPATDSTTVIVAVNQADLSIVKSGVNSIQRGSTMLYTLTATNAGPNTATNVTMADPIPAGLTFNAAQSDVSCIQNGANILCNNLTLTSGQSKTVLIAFDVPSTFTCNGTISNQASVSTSATDPNPANNQSTVISTTVTCPPATFSITKTDGRTTAAPADTLTYTITVQNTSAVNATNVTVTDTLPSNATFVSASGGTLAGNTVTFVIPTLNAGQSVQRTVIVTVNAGTANGTVLTNTASVNGTTATDTTTVTVVAQQADLSITKTGVSTIQRGSTILYTLTATNAGPNTATNVTIADAVPAGLTFAAAQSDVSCVLNGVNVLCNNFTLTSGQSKTVIVAFNVPSTFTCNGMISNQASVSTSATDPNPANNQSATVSTSVTCPPATFTISKTDNRTTALPGDTLNYAIIVTNTSVTNATNVTVTDTLPSNVTFVSATGGTLAGNVVTFVIPAINAGQSATRMVSVTVNAGTASGTVLSNTAAVSGTTATDTTTVSSVAQQADLSITKTGVSTIQRGSTILYTLTATNAGPNTATNVTIADPAGLTFVAAQSDASCILNGANILCNNFSLTSGQSKTVIVAFSVPSTFTCNGTIQNQASVSTSITDLNSANNQSQTVSTTVTCPTNTFTIAKTDNKTTATPGETLTYVITVRNTSATTVTNVNVTDTLPGNITFLSASGGVLAGNVVTFTIPSMGSGQTITRNVVITVNPGVTNGTVLTNTANVGTFQIQDTTTIQTGATFSITKTDNKTTAAPGETLTYAIVVTNTSATAATGISVTDTLPSNVTFLSATGAVRNGNTVTWSGINLTAGQSVTLPLQVQINSGVANGTVITNSASVGTVTVQDTTTVQTSGTATLTLSLSDSQDPVTPGQTFNYNVILTNATSTLASGVNVQQVLDGDSEFLSTSNSGTQSNGVISWTNLSVPANGSLTLVTTVRAKSTTQDGEILNSTAFSASISDSETTLIRGDGSNNDTAITLTVRDSADPVQIDECFDEIITVRNGRGITESVDVTGFLDPDMEFRDADRGGNQVGNDRVEWTDIVISANSSVTLHVTVCVDANAFDGRNLQFRARAEGSEDTEYTRVIDNGFLPPPIVPVPPFGEAIVTVDKSADRQEAQAGSVILYTVTIRNEGQTSTEDLVVEDSFTAGTVTVEEAGGGVMTGNGITWTGVRIGANSTRVLQYRVRVGAGMRNGEVISNTVTVRGGLTVVTDSEDVRILSNLPQAGGGGFLRADTTKHLRPRVAQEDASPITNLPMMVWTQILAIGLAAGSMIGRKLIGW